MFMFGILKVLIPTINGWYSIQMTNSGLGEYIPVWLGILGEILVGLTLIISLIFRQKIPQNIFLTLTQMASFIIIIMMATAVYVHLSPNVPAEVLPLKIKPPYIPIFTLLLALTNIILLQGQKKKG